MARVDVRAWVMLGYLVVWSAIMLFVTVRTGIWPPATAWATLGAGEGALMAAWRVDEAWRRRAGNGHDVEDDE